MAVNFPDSPSNGDTTVINGATYTWDGVKWDTTSFASNVTATYDSPLNLPTTGLTNGDVAWVGGSTNKLYISNGTGWLSATLTNSAPVINSVQDASAGTTPFSLATDGTPTVITIDATDPESFGLTYSYSVTSGALGTTATVSQADNVFTITPGTNDPADVGTFELTFSVYDGVNTVTSVADFSLQFVGDYDRAIFTGGTSGSGGTTPIEYMSISTGGDTVLFGSLQTQRGYHTSAGNKDRALMANGETTGANVYTSDIEYVVPSTLGNGVYFGSNGPAKGALASVASDTYALFAGGGSFSGSWTYYYDIKYVTIATTSSSTSFGSLSSLNMFLSSADNGTYGYFAGGGPNGGNFVNYIERVTISTSGSSSSFGNLSSTKGECDGGGDATYILFGGGGMWAGRDIDQLNATSGGSATKVGELSVDKYSHASADDGITILWAGGYGSGHYSNIEKTTIASAGNATAVGDLLTARYRVEGTSGAAS